MHTVAAIAADGAVGTAASAADGAVRLRGGTMAADGEVRLPAADGAVGLRGRTGLEGTATGMGSGLSLRRLWIRSRSDGVDVLKSCSSNDSDTPNMLSAVTLSMLEPFLCK